ncbi:MAG TPA: hypothetical protein VE544_00585, partial [Nitrososphaeraceae archaeon]|nr:hypothetical protein [Nitrososphaeraceae archaeon]
IVLGYHGKLPSLDGWWNLSRCGRRPMGQSAIKVPRPTEMTTDNNGKDKNTSYGKLKWTELIILTGAIVVATLFILFYFSS